MFRGLTELFLAHKHSRESWDPKHALLGKDRRIFQRVSVQMPCRIDNPQFGLESQASTVNLSLGGIGVTAGVTWPEGSHVRVSFNSLVLDGLIVFRRDVSSENPECRYGIRFQKLGFKDLLKLRRVLQDNHRGPLAAL